MKLVTPSNLSATNTIKVLTGSYSQGLGKFWGIWIVALVLVLLIFSLVLNVAPFLHIDEFMTVDLGRVILQPDSAWSIAWMTERSQPAFVFFYIGPVLQELAYLGLGEYGPRISGVEGAFVAATAIVRYFANSSTGVSSTHSIQER